MINNENIQAFLSIVQYGNITAAANATYTSQSRLSKQIRLLEEEVGVQLLIRNKGHSEVSLTPHGKEFLAVARKWEGLLKDFDQIRFSTSLSEVSIGAPDRFNFLTLKNFYRSILGNYKNIRIDCHTRHSREIYTMMENQQLDLGIVTTLLPVFSLKVQPLFTETMYCICNKENDFPAIISPSDLDPEKEIYSRWSDEYEVWHDQYWPGKRYRLHVGTGTMVSSYLDKPGYWAVVPITMLEGMKEYHDFTTHQLRNAYPATKIYLLEQKHPRQARASAIDIIKNELVHYLDTYKK